MACARLPLARLNGFGAPRQPLRLLECSSAPASAPSVAACWCRNVSSQHPRLLTWRTLGWAPPPPPLYWAWEAGGLKDSHTPGLWGRHPVFEHGHAGQPLHAQLRRLRMCAVTSRTAPPRSLPPQHSLSMAWRRVCGQPHHVCCSPFRPGVFHEHCVAPWLAKHNVCPMHETIWQPCPARMCPALLGS